MEECGAFLLKDANPHFFSHPDIPFIPDAWQKEVLEKIDENSSCLIVAPTSAGKSFISFYTISHVLQNLEQNEAATTGNNSKKTKQSKKNKPASQQTKSNTTHQSDQKVETTEVEEGLQQEATTEGKKTTKFKGKSLQARVVFVAPTLPLCNQMIAMVSHRYIPLFCPLLPASPSFSCSLLLSLN